MDKKLTIKQIADTLQIPESTIRFYRDRFEEYVPSIGTGRKRRYPENAIEVFRIIAESYERNMTAEEIKERLSLEFARNVQIVETNSSSVTVAQQNEFQQVLTLLAQAISEVAATQQYIIEQMERMQEESARREQELLNRLEERDKLLNELITQWREEKQTQKKGFFARLFRK